MAVWIALEPTVFDHRKTLRLSIRLGLRETHLVGHLARLWTWALANAPTGELHDVEAQVIARAADWTGDLLEIADAETFVGALVEVGFLDHRDGDGGGLVLHGFRERHEAWAERRESEQAAEDREGERRRKQRELKAAQRARGRGDVSTDGDRTMAGLSGDMSGGVGGHGSNGHRTGGAVSGDRSGPVHIVSPDRPGGVLARPDRTGPGPDPDRSGSDPDVSTPLYPPTGGAPPAPRTRGEGRRRVSRSGSFFDTRYGVLACPAGCRDVHGGVAGLSELAALWRAGDNGMTWLSFARTHGRGDVGDDEAPPGDSSGNAGGES